MSQTVPWNHGLFNICAGGAGVCLTATFCPCVQYGRNVHIIGDGDFVPNCCLFLLCSACSCIIAAPKRTSMRAKYNLEEVCINDCVTTCCCGCCSQIQIAAEIDTRGVPQAPGQQRMA